MTNQTTAEPVGCPLLSRQQGRNPAILPQQALCTAAADHTHVTFGTPRHVPGHYHVSATLSFGSRRFAPESVNKVYGAFGTCCSGVDGKSDFLNTGMLLGSLRSTSQAVPAWLGFGTEPVSQGKPEDNDGDHGKVSAMNPTNPRNRCGDSHPTSGRYASRRIHSLFQKTA